MKKITKNLLFIVLGILIAGILYYIYLPAVNIHSANFWFFLMGLLIVCMLIYGFKKAAESGFSGDEGPEIYGYSADCRVSGISCGQYPVFHDCKCRKISTASHH